MNTYPNFRSRKWLKQQIFQTLDFYYPQCMDVENGGFYQTYNDNGTVEKSKTKNLVSTCRFIFNFSVGCILGHESVYKAPLQHGLHFLQNHFLDKENGGYFWELEGTSVTDSTKYTYGQAFALLALSKATEAGSDIAKHALYELFDVLEANVYDASYNLYEDTLSSNWHKHSNYRGQNANMHLCEACISAYEATQDDVFIERAKSIAYTVTHTLLNQTEGLIWESYHTDWTVDWDYNKGDTKSDEFRPYGFIAAHSVEWSKLLVMIEKHAAEDWMLPQAEALYQRAMSKGWDGVYGGLVYSLYPQHQPIDTDKYYWTVAELIGASALLALRTDNQQYWLNYQQSFAHAYQYFMDLTYGGWFATLNRKNEKYSTVKSDGSKADYHPIENYFEVYKAITPEKRVASTN